MTTDIALEVHKITTETNFLILCAAVIVFLLIVREFRSVMIFSLALVMTAGSVWIMKHLFEVPRPQGALIDVPSYAFPSGHAAISFFTATIVTWLPGRHKKMHPKILILLGGALFVAAALVSFSRIVLGVHTWIQVIVGALLGVCVPFAIIYFEKYFRT